MLSKKFIPVPLRSASVDRYLCLHTAIITFRSATAVLIITLNTICCNPKGVIDQLSVAEYDSVMFATTAL